MKQKKVNKKSTVPSSPVIEKKTLPNPGFALNKQPGLPGFLKFLLIITPLLLIVFYTFFPAIKNSFLNWDDNIYVLENHYLEKPIPEAVKYFFGPHFFIGNYIPLTMILFALEFHSSGLDPMFFHLVNVFIHLANVGLVFWFIFLLSGKKPMVAAIVALFFGIHPMHVESVAWIAELKDMLFSFFFLAGLIAYYKYVDRYCEKAIAETKEHYKPFQGFRSRFPYLALLFFILSVLSKPAAVTFPLVLMLIDFYVRRKPGYLALIEKLPFFIVSIIFGIITIISQKTDNLIHDYYPFYQRLFFASHSILRYIWKLLIPIHLSIFYPYPEISGGYLPFIFYVAPLLVAGLFYGVYRTLKFSRLIVFGFLFYLINILLILQLLSIGDAIIADRYTYIPYIGLFFILAMGFDKLFFKQDANRKIIRPAMIIGVLMLAVSCVFITRDRIPDWKTDVTIADDLLNKFPDDRLALNNKGFILFEQGNYQEAIDLFTKSIELKPDYLRAYMNLINCYIALNDSDKAMKWTDNALKIAPNDFNVLNTKGYLLTRQLNYTGALKYYKEAMALKKDDLNNYIYLSKCYYLLHDYDNWIKTIDAGLQLDPDNFVLLNNKGYFFYLNRRYSEALGYYKEALSRKPDFETARVNLQACYQALNDSTGKHHE